MALIADAEKFRGNSHWTLYDGKGGVWHARRDTTCGMWYAYEQRGSSGYVRGKTLHEVRLKVAEATN